ncbi:TPA: ead/Ea22-like family protein [Salmonella enterica subsp. enterica]|uniref:ead/Ea22-like family protein n=1 Tax=Salmonella enterica TaxID=28901 RepID=UPI0012C3618E|nr:ead/Ea22-like family protein [Salmonella enterica]HBM1692948.1 ead/Ea22-like family protein [Salmonella enterica subsp. enterica]EBY0917186.1 ead/Ea22-like family protein [Salmonella enterica subsp. enterica serovar Kentucky]EBY3641021.1 ead/Ea22-like family protein [Salmonella enterica subsp. enterica serovar Kentucky]EBZ6853685.1 ead/Ea22-like family protein [Salmonella enterica subsp. enterica serovar Kentucky]ECA6949942.1 ead/Ea22-like family protein [Salmonella enterica subsp. enterica
MTALNKQALRQLAEKAIGAYERLSAMPADEIFDISLHEGTQLDADITALNAFNESANPKTMLAILDRQEAVERRVAEQQSAIIAPGIMRCAGCGFVLTKNNINMTTGTITARDSKTEPCPNGCGPLWPVTWKEQAIQMRDDSEQWFLELQQAKNRIAELEARTVMLPTPYPKGYGLAADKYNFALEECADALRAAGIGVKGE